MLYQRVMNNLIRFKMKMLIVLTFCVFMTFSMLVYVMNLTEKCENSVDETCFSVSKNPIVKSNYFFYKVYHNYTAMTSQLLKPSVALPGSWDSTTEKAYNNKSKRTTREVFEIFNISSSNYLSKNLIGNNSKQVPLFSVKPNSYSSIKNSTTVSSFVPPSFQKPASEANSPLDSNLLEIFNGKFKFSSVYSERKKNLLNLCHKYFTSNQILKIKKLQLKHILIDEQHKLLYCYVPKVACTNWKRIFLVLTGKARNISEVINLPSSEIHAKNLFKSLQNFSLPDVQKIAEEYTKFIFVRHPFERLLSAYRNKLEQHYDSSKYFQARFGKFIIKNFRKNPSNMSLEKGDDVTFAEFAHYLVSSDPQLYNEHWQRVADLCHPCLINYDFIGKYETLIEDSNYLLKYLGWNFSFPLLPKPSTTASNLKKYYNTLTKTTIFKLYSIYQMDFRLFGYDLFNTSDLFNS